MARFQNNWIVENNGYIQISKSWQDFKIIDIFKIKHAKNLAHRSLTLFMVLCLSLPFFAFGCRSLPFSAVLCLWLSFFAFVDGSLPFSGVLCLWLAFFAFLPYVSPFFDFLPYGSPTARRSLPYFLVYCAFDACALVKKTALVPRLFLPNAHAPKALLRYCCAPLGASPLGP
jgi:hypothetical protein